MESSDGTGGSLVAGIDNKGVALVRDSHLRDGAVGSKLLVKVRMTGRVKKGGRCGGHLE